MGAILKLENKTAVELKVQVELAGSVSAIMPNETVLIDTDFERSEELHIQIKEDWIVVWGGVAAHCVEDDSGTNR